MPHSVITTRFSGMTQGDRLTQSSAHAQPTCRNGLLASMVAPPENIRSCCNSSAKVMQHGEGGFQKVPGSQF